ncbi:helix-turn-helix domain-containing protein [Streptacidiphilus sp. EB103A]|uniref:helix-turn-helix domain-containing protein n=1 Tax=Streptacidiphilus sp. EB103A TaxID=3156275 RepID=UPI0035164298
MATPVVPHEPRPTPRTAKRLKDEQVQELILAYTGGSTVFQLGDRFGIDRRTVGAILKRNGVDTNRHSLTEEAAKEAVLLYEQGRSLASIAKQMNVSYSTLRTKLLKRGVKMRGVNGQERP